MLIARALASGSPLLVLDEPAAALDLHNQSRVLSLLRDLVGDGMGVLLTTHHPDHALFLADDVVLMHGPDDVRTGPAAGLLSDEQLSALYAVPVHSVAYTEGGEQRRGLVTGYASSPPAPRLSPEPLPARTAPRRR